MPRLKLTPVGAMIGGGFVSTLCVAGLLTDARSWSKRTLLAALLILLIAAALVGFFCSPASKP